MIPGGGRREIWYFPVISKRLALLRRERLAPPFRFVWRGPERRSGRAAAAAAARTHAAPAAPLHVAPPPPPTQKTGRIGIATNLREKRFGLFLASKVSVLVPVQGDGGEEAAGAAVGAPAGARGPCVRAVGFLSPRTPLISTRTFSRQNGRFVDIERNFLNIIKPGDVFGH